MKILIVYPNRYRLLRPPPVGASIVARAAQEAGHEVRLLDLMFAKDPSGELARELGDFQPELVGFNLRNIDNQAIDEPRSFIPEYAALIAQAEAAVPTVVGGTALMAMPEEVFRASGATYGLCGPAAKTFPRWLEERANGVARFETPGAMWHEEGAVRLNPYSIDAYGSEGRIGWRFFDSGRYRGPEMGACVITKSGCPYRCLFCDARNRFGSRFFPRDPELVVEELRADAAEHGHNRFLYFFIDPCFNEPVDWAKRLCEALIRAELKLGWSAILEPTGDTDEELVSLMRRSGCIMVTSLVGSLDEGMHERLQRPGSVADIDRCFALLEKHGIDYMPQLLLGGPGESPGTVEASLRFLERRAPLMVDIGWGLRIMPGAGLYQVALDEGVVGPDTDMLEPRFYLSEGLDPAWLRARVKAWGRWRMPPLWLWTRMIARTMALRF
jgi:radical SAM superfamily enzyme YgiQ (UPF0313 family)